MHSLTSKRLRLRRICKADASFVLELMNDPDWLEYVGDRSLKSIADAEAFISSRFEHIYETSKVGFMMVECIETAERFGICGLVDREEFEDIDLGFGFLAQHRRAGYALESSLVCLQYAKEVLGLERVIAITDQGNVASIKLLERLGFDYEKLVPFGDEEELLRMFTNTLL